jgi:hypothetical protein
MSVAPGVDVVAFLALLVGIVILPFYVWSIVWAVRDAAGRGKSGLLVAILVAFLNWPLGLVIWLLIRPDSLDDLRTAYLSCQCGSSIPFEERMAGTTATCTSCGSEMVVPELSQLRKMIAEQVTKGRPIHRP